ncbi:hypothetical protein [Clostridium saccharoperbutylacetonicum]|uniref:hypothetical protein n=1 Tax=Clostridium saccharoperbutylacetonicum TaxID=36745 RepID=UPI0039E751EF
MEYEKVKNFCYSICTSDTDLERQFENEDGYKILLAITRQINEYANQVKCICNTIDALEGWKKESFFKLNETTYEINWNGTCRDNKKERVTLAQAKKIYKEIRVKYDTLYELFEDSAQIHYEEDPTVLIDKYFSYTKY